MTEKSHEPVSEALAKLLTKSGMTQADLCRAAGVNPGTVSRYLSGGRGTRVDARSAQAIEKVALALGVEADHFMEYRAWRIREITFARPDLMDNFYDLIIETAKLPGLLRDPTSDAK